MLHHNTCRAVRSTVKQWKIEVDNEPSADKYNAFCTNTVILIVNCLTQLAADYYNCQQLPTWKRYHLHRNPAGRKLMSLKDHERQQWLTILLGADKELLVRLVLNHSCKLPERARTYYKNNNGTKVRLDKIKNITMVKCDICDGMYNEFYARCPRTKVRKLSAICQTCKSYRTDETCSILNGRWSKFTIILKELERILDIDATYIEPYRGVVTLQDCECNAVYSKLKMMHKVQTLLCNPTLVQGVYMSMSDTWDKYQYKTLYFDFLDTFHASDTRQQKQILVTKFIQKVSSWKTV